MSERILYHGSDILVEFPDVRKTKYTKDFSWGFYCTSSLEQASRWASRRKKEGMVSQYEYHPSSDLNILLFSEMDDKWLDFIAYCRSGGIHDYDVVEGPMADDTIWNYVNDYLEGDITKAVFWEYARFRHPTQQISFHTLKALNCLQFQKGIEIYGGEIKE